MILNVARYTCGHFFRFLRLAPHNELQSERFGYLSRDQSRTDNELRSEHFGYLSRYQSRTA